MVSALQAVSVALVSVLSGAGWFLWTPKGGDAPTAGSVVFEGAAAPFAAVPADRRSARQPYPAWRECAMRSTLVPSAARASVSEVALTAAEHRELQHGRWLVLVYAPWCPHSKAYLMMWREMVARLRAKPPPSLPVLAAVSLSSEPALAALLAVHKLPSFYMVQDGHVKGSTVSSPSLEVLLAFAEADWSKYPQTPRRLPDQLPQIAAFQLRVFDLLGRTAFLVQEQLVELIDRNKTTAYALVALLLAAAYYGCKCRFLAMF